MTRGFLASAELAALAGRVERLGLRAVADALGIYHQTVARLLRGAAGNGAVLAVVRGFLAQPEPEPEPEPAPVVAVARLPVVEDVHEATGGACRAEHESCARACRYVLATAALGSRCALEVAAEGSHTLEEVGAALGVTRERVRQIEAAALPRARRSARRMGLSFEPFEGRHVDVPDEAPDGFAELRRGIEAHEARRREGAA